MLIKLGLEIHNYPELSSIFKKAYASILDKKQLTNGYNREFYGITL
jgi:hypothetical protein